MIDVLAQSQADRMRLAASSLQSISPYLNPAHVLSPPRDWLEALVHGEFSWEYFRLRYKNLLWKRFRDEPHRFFHLLDASEGARKLHLTCHCLTTVCHRELARDFLESLRDHKAYADWRMAQSLPWMAPSFVSSHATLTQF